MTAASDTVCILLAAGLSRRFGPSNKLEAQFRGKPLASHAIDTMKTIDFAAHLVVTGRETAGLFGKPFETVVNDQPEAGISHSIALGVKTAKKYRPQAVLITLSDMPLLPSTHFVALLEALETHEDAAIIATGNDGRAQVPALFKSSKFEELTELTGDTGARDLLKSAHQVACDPRYLLDFDTPQAIENWQL